MLSSISSLAKWASHLGARCQDLGPGPAGLTPDATLGLDLVCSPSQSPSVLSAPFSKPPSAESLHFFLSNFLFVRWELPHSKKTSYLLSDVLIFFKDFLGPLKRPPFLLPEFSVQPTLVGTATFPVSIQEKPKGAAIGLRTIRLPLSIYTYTLSLVAFVGWKHPVQMMQRVVSLLHSLQFFKAFD